jgi:hypothetical protein
MKTINLSKIIKDNNLKVKEVAQELFPNIKYPKLALDRILRGESRLDSDQLSRLSMYTGMSIEQIYTGENWQKPEARGNLLTLHSGEYRAEINTDSWTTKLFHKQTIMHDLVIHQKAITLDNYINDLNTRINNYKLNFEL